jgi:Ser/Thr protein kinase RdoA (MazF antagonist)
MFCLQGIPYLCAPQKHQAMNIFPVQYSTLSAKALGERIAAHYDIPVRECRFLLRGVSDTYVISTTGPDKFVFKLYRDVHRSLHEIKGEAELLEVLGKGGARVVQTVPAADGSIVLSLQAPEGQRNGVLFTFAKGRALGSFNDKQLDLIGREMAFNHNITAKVQLQWERGEYNTATTVLRPLSLLEPAFEEYYPEGYVLLKNTAEQVVRQLAAIDTSGFSTGYCHYDYFPHNFFFDEEYNFTLFDFDFAGKGFLVYDLATLYVHFFFDRLYRKKNETEAQAEFDRIVAGYRQLRSLSEDELKAMPLLAYQMLLFYLGFQYENFDDWSNTFFGTRYLKERVGAMEQFADLFCREGNS